MRRRRIVGIAAAAAAGMLALTAAVLPSTPPNPPVKLPALTTQALSARYAASSRAIARAETAATQDGNTALAHSLAAMRHGHFLAFNSAGQGEAVQVLGNLATARRVVIMVPGSDTSLATWSSRGAASPFGGARALANETARLDPHAHLAIIAWLGYRTPSLLSPAVLTSGNAGQGAQALRPLVTGLARDGDQVALLCHSYGSVVCGLAAPHLPVTDIAVYGSPGMDVSSVRSLDTTARVWAGREVGGLDPRRAARPAARPGLRRRPDVAVVRRPPVRPAAATGTAATSARAAPRCATWPTSRWASPGR